VRRRAHLSVRSLVRVTHRCSFTTPRHGRNTPARDRAPPTGIRAAGPGGYGPAKSPIPLSPRGDASSPIAVWNWMRVPAYDAAWLISHVLSPTPSEESIDAGRDNLVVTVANTIAFEAPLAAPGGVLVASRSWAARRLLRPCQASTSGTSRCDRTRDGDH
jgi:hypothetical protein